MRVSTILIESFIHPLFGAIGAITKTENFKYDWKKVVFCLAFLFAALAYCYIPLPDEDLHQYATYIGTLKSKSLLASLSYGRYASEQAYIFIFFCWIASRFGGYHLLTATSTFIVYYIGFSICCIVGNDYQSSPSDIRKNIIFIILASNFFGILNNVHNILAFSIVGYAIFRDVYQKKRNAFTIFLYIIPLFLHFTAAIFVLIRLILLLPSLSRKVVEFILLFSGLIIEFLYGLVANIGLTNIITKFIYSVTESAYTYFFDVSSDYALRTQASTLQTVIKLIYMALSLCFILQVVTYNRDLKNGDDTVSLTKCLPIISITAIMALACFPMTTPEYWRFAAVSIMMSGLVFAPSYYLVSSIKLFCQIKIIMWILASCNFALSLFRLFAIYDFKSLLINFVTTFPVIEFIKIIFGQS